MSSDDDCPWASNESEEQQAPGKMSKVFTVDNYKYLDLKKMHKKLLKLVKEVNKVVDVDRWNASAVQDAIGAIDWYIERNYKKFQRYLLSGLVKREETIEMELLLSKNVREVSY
jgi:hypothetical protein